MSRLCHALLLIAALCTACSSDDSATDQSNGSPNGGNNSGGSGGSAQGDTGVAPTAIALRSGPSSLGSTVLGFSTIADDFAGEISFTAPVIDGWVNGIAASRVETQGDTKFDADSQYFSEDMSDVVSLRLPASPSVKQLKSDNNELTFSWQQDTPSGATARTMTADLFTSDAGKDWTFNYFVVTQGDVSSVTVPDLSSLGLPSLVAATGKLIGKAYSPITMTEILTGEVEPIYDEVVWVSSCERSSK